jgi:glycosyltransferase involved in cell wall biosynthesis
MNISFLTSGHEPFDDRIFYHMARSLADHNNNVLIISSKADIVKVVEGIGLNCFAGDNLSKRDKINKFIYILSGADPDVIICSEPLTVLAAKRYRSQSGRRVRIIYDITEWYPLRSHLRNIQPGLRVIHFFKLLIFNCLISRFADSFIFGEFYKSKPYRFLYPRKSFIWLPYYPDIKNIPFTKPDLAEGKLSLHYSGEISISRGYLNFFNVINKISQDRKELKIEVIIIGWYQTKKDIADCESFMKSDFSNITLRIFEKQSYSEYLNLIKETDVFVDLRADNIANNYNLPIKLFNYLALGRPVIFSDLKAIRREMSFDSFGFLVKPSEVDRIAGMIKSYLDNKELYYLHCRNAREAAINKYSWNKIETEFIQLISHSFCGN